MIRHGPKTGTARDPLPGSLQMVVGFDGSAPALRALDAAARLIRGRTGFIHIVYVARMPAPTAVSANAYSELADVFDEKEQKLALESRQHLMGIEERWSFQRRSGDIVMELIEAARQLSKAKPGRRDDDTMIVVGASTRSVHRRVASVPVALVRRTDVQLLVVP